MKNSIDWKSRLSSLPLLLAMIFLAFAIFLPDINLNRPVHHYQLTFDISQSMNVEDVKLDGKTVSRLTLARAAAQNLLQEVPCGSRVGWSVFTGTRNLTLLKPIEVCKHYDGLSAALEQIDGRMRWYNGSGIGKGLHQSLRAANEIGDGAAVVMITDGHEAPPLRPGQQGIPKKTRGMDVPGIVIGVGGSAPMPIPKTDDKGRVIGNWLPHEVIQKPGTAGRPGNEELSSLKSKHLIQLAQIVELDYHELKSPNDLSKALFDAKLTKIAPSPVDLRWIPALLALLCVCWRFLPAINIKN